MAKDGWIKLHRKIIENDIFCWKPAEWFKIWIYILLTVNFDNGNLPRGTGYFRRAWEHITNENSESKIREWQWHNCIRFLKKQGMITTQKTTRGMRIRVLKYEVYQIQKQTQNKTRSKTQARHKQDTSNTILKECKKEKNERTKILSQIENLKSQFPEEIKLLVMEYIEITKNRNKTGKIGLNREKRLVNELLTEWMATETDAVLRNDFKQALRITVENEAPHINYLKKVKKGLPHKRKVRLKKGYKKWK